MLRLPLGQHLAAPHSLVDAALAGADVQPVSAPIDAVLAARAQPTREMVFFVAGFETLLAPLAGMILEGLPANLSVLICGRRVDPLLEQMLQRGEARFDALLLPGNRCAVTGTRAWERLSDEFRVPAAVAGYTGSNILNALHLVLRQHCAGEVRVDNCYRALVRADGNAMARDQLYRVFEQADGDWRGVGGVRSSAFRLRHAYAILDADHRYPDYRSDVEHETAAMPRGCECASVLLGQKEPSDCEQFSAGCQSAAPYGPCMASEDGTCNLRSGLRHLA